MVKKVNSDTQFRRLLDRIYVNDSKQNAHNKQRLEAQLQLQVFRSHLGKVFAWLRKRGEWQPKKIGQEIMSANVTDSNKLDNEQGCGNDINVWPGKWAEFEHRLSDWRWNHR